MLFLPFAFMPLEVGKVIMVVGSAVVAWWISTIIYNYVNARGRELPCSSTLVVPARVRC